MDTRQLARIDLNLLVALQVLIEEGNVSRAAERLFITQSAMSKTLGRLRELFDDPLFTRSSHGMVATPRALEIQKKLNLVLHDVQGLVAPKEFNPAHYHGEFKIAVPEYIGMVILPRLMEELQEQAPHIRIVSISRAEHQLEQLAEGSLDLVIHIRYAQYGADFTLDPVGSLPPIMLVRQAHPLRAQRRAVRFEDALKYPQVRLYMPDIDEVVGGRPEPNTTAGGREVEVVFETSHMFTAIEVVKRTNCILFGPPFISRHPQLGVGVVSIPIPMSKENYIHYVMVSHRRVESSPMHQWLRQKILDIAHRDESKTESGDPYSDYRADHRLSLYDGISDRDAGE